MVFQIQDLAKVGSQSVYPDEATRDPNGASKLGKALVIANKGL